MFRHIRTRILALSLPIAFLAIFCSFILNVESGKKILNEQITQQIQARQLEQVAVVQAKIQTVRTFCTTLSSVVSQTYKNTTITSYEHILGSEIQKDSFVLGAGIWFEPFAFDSTKTYEGPYVYKDGTSIISTYNYSNASYDYFSQEYYEKAKETGQTIITDPYYDQTLDLYMITCSTPITDSNGEFLGCVSVDVALPQLQELVNSFVEESGGTAFILDNNGRYLATPDMNLVKNGKYITSENNQSLQEAGKSIVSNDSGQVSFQQDGKSYRIYFSTIPDVNWKVIYQIPESSIRTPISQLSIILLTIGICMAIFIAADITFVTKKTIVKPINLLVQEFETIKSGLYTGNSTCGLEQRKDEFGTLGAALNEMKFHLKQALEEKDEALEENIAARDELEHQNDLLEINKGQLIESINYTRSIIGVIPDILFIISRDGIFLDCQGSSDNLLYASKNEFIGKNLYEVMTEDIAQLAMGKINALFETGTLQTLKYNIDLNGQVENFELRISQYSSDKVIAIARMITEEETHLTQIEYLSYHDQVTGLHNRRFMDEELIRQEASGMLPISIIFADVNGLKLVNDSFGHAEGDLLLKKFAQVLVATCNESNLIARIGGDEFAVILPNTNESDAEKLIRKLSDNCEKESVNAIILSVSMGYGTKTRKTQHLRDVLKIAEDMMYKKKMYEAPSRRSKTIGVIVNTLHEKNPREEQHSYRVAQLCVALADSLDMSGSDKKKIQSAALLHDIGKIGVPESYLNKAGKLTPAEYKTMCRHPEIGYRIIQSANDMTEIAEIILTHHEKWDGSGYPSGLKGIEIPYISRIITIADAFDAMTNVRSYRSPVSEEEAAREIIRNAGTQFDPDLAYLFVKKVLHIEIDNLKNSI